MDERRLEKRVELDTTPDQVWEAIATDHGIATWFVPHRLEPGAGGAIEQDYGGGFVTSGRVTAWEPGRRLAYGAFDQPPDGRPDYAYKFLVEGRAGGGAVLRFVQSGFLDGPERADEYDSFDNGWNLFFLNLRSYLEHFAGLPVQNVVSMTCATGSRRDLWPVLHRALGLAGQPAVGDPITLAPAGPEPNSGLVDVANGESLGVRSAHGLHRIGAEGEDGCGVSAYHYIYGRPVDTGALTAAWQTWLSTLFPGPS